MRNLLNYRNWKLEKTQGIKLSESKQKKQELEDRCIEQVRIMIEENPKSKQKDMAIRLTETMGRKISQTYVCRILKKANLSFKKVRIYMTLGSYGSKREAFIHFMCINYKDFNEYIYGMNYLQR